MVRELLSSMSVPKTILVPTDFSETAEAALDYAVDLASKLDAKIHLVSVIGAQLIGSEYGIAMTTSMMEAACGRQQGRLDELVAARASKASFGPAVLETGDARIQIDQVARRIGADLIVMGTHGRQGIQRLLLGSVAEAVSRVAPCPVLLVRKGVS